VGRATRVTGEGSGEGEDEKIRVTEDDLENIVDELSEGEDEHEDLAAAKRKQERALSEKAGTDKILDRLKYGWNASRGSARGRFNHSQIVNEKFADEAGLVTRGEEESAPAAAVEFENESEQLDHILKDRHLGSKRQASISDDEASEDEDEVTAPQGTEANQEAEQEAADEREQERAARRRVKRAKMRKLLSEQAKEGGASQSRFVEEDEESQSMLSMLKMSGKSAARRAGRPGLVRQASFGSSAGADSQEDSQLSSSGFGRAASFSDGQGLLRKGSFVNSLRSKSAATVTAGRTVSNSRFVFAAAEDSSQGGGGAWEQHVKTEQAKGAPPSQPARPVPGSKKRGGGMSTAMWTAMAANRFKKPKSSK